LRIRTYLRYTHPTNVIEKCREASGVKRHKKYDMLKKILCAVRCRRGRD